ncbi:MAG: social motility TPR repeat lipoprotein Tgl [Myxococcaceae bacterium]
MPLRIHAILTAAAVLSCTVAGCKHVPTEKELQGSQIHYDLGIQAQTAGDLTGAYKEYEEALRLDPKFPEAHNAIALLLHLTFKKYEDAISHYRTALEIRPAFAEAKVNLANLYLDQSRYDDAITLYEQVLNDILYVTPYIAQTNLGWALYKKGNVRRAIESTKAAVTTNPKFCLGYRNLGIIHDSQNEAEEGCRYFQKYQESCPDTPDAHYRAGVCQAKLGRSDVAKKSFEECQAKGGNETLKEDCHRLAEQLK